MSDPLAVRLRRRGRAELLAARERLLSAAEQRAAERPLLQLVEQARPRVRAQLDLRLGDLLAALGHPVPPAQDRAARVAAVERALEGADEQVLWLALSVLTGRLALDEEVVEARRRLRLDGPSQALVPALTRAASRLTPGGQWDARVRVLVGAVTVDMHHTSRTELATGIQRVARETARRWSRDEGVELLGWDADYTALRPLDALGRRRAGDDRLDDAAAAQADARAAQEIVVPWQGTHVVLELATEPGRTDRMRSLARWSGNRTGLVGLDCVPLTSAETTADAMGGAFARLLAAVRHVDRVSCISAASAAEYRGWCRMLVGSGLPGPEVGVTSLPVAADPPTPAALEQARSRLRLGSAPMVLVVGSHEPRKNHLAVLHAAELLWREGLVFNLVLVGGNAWKGERFVGTLSGLVGQGRPVEALSALDDASLWAAYALADVVLFPSLNEGFGLPIAEALAAGTPVITSRHGSMLELAEHGGALLVDPRDDHDVADALRRLITDQPLRARLAAEAAAVPQRSWDDYARELWQALVAPADAQSAGSAA